MNNSGILSVAMLAMMGVQSTEVKAQNEQVSKELPTELIVFKNSEVKCVRLDSIVTRSAEPEVDDYYSKVEVEYKMENGLPTYMSMAQMANEPLLASVLQKSRLQIVSGCLFEQKTVSNTLEDGTIITKKYLGPYLSVSATYNSDQRMTESVMYNYNERFDCVSKVTSQYDAEGNLTGGTKVERVIDIDKEDSSKWSVTETTSVLQPSTGKYLATQRIQSEYQNQGWLNAQHRYAADENGEFGDWCYELKREVRLVDEEQSDETQDDTNQVEVMYTTSDFITTVEDGVKKEREEMTSFISYYDNFYEEEMECALTYRRKSNGEMEETPYKIQRKVMTFCNTATGVRNYAVATYDAEKDETSGDITFYYTDGDTNVEEGTWVAAPLLGMEDAAYRNLFWLSQHKYTYEYAKRNDIIAGWVTKKYSAMLMDGGWNSQECKRDLNYVDVYGSDGLCPIIYLRSNYDAYPFDLISTFYYSSENGKEVLPTAIIQAPASYSVSTPYTLDGRIDNGKGRGIRVVNGKKVF